MNKAELIRKISKNVGVPDTDAKIFFELFLKRISAVVSVGQSIFINDFGYFHLIKGRIKKPIFSFNDNQVLEEEVDLVLFSEDKNLRKSDTKGLVFNIPFFDEEDYHPIDSTFSLSIGKPLIPLRGVPFDNIYIPTSGYEYRRLIESKVEKLIAASAIADSEENFPTLVIDARSYNSSQVQLQWSDTIDTDTIDQSADKKVDSVEAGISEYQKQTDELKNIAWDFGEDLSQQIEAESILDITDERISLDFIPKNTVEKNEETISNSDFEVNDKASEEENLIPEKVIEDEPEFIEEISTEDSSQKLNELLESESKPLEFVEEGLLDVPVNEVESDEIYEIKIDDEYEEVKPNINENIKIEDAISDDEFWKSTSKYFEPFNPSSDKSAPEDFIEDKSIPFNPEDFDSKENVQFNLTEPGEVSMSIDNPIEDEVSKENVEEDKNEFKDVVKNVSEENIELEKVVEQKAEYYEAEKKRNLVPFIVFPLIIILVSVALYWYLEFYKKNETTVKAKQIVLKSDNAKIVARSFDFPITYPYLPKVNETTISETVAPKIEEQNVTENKIEAPKDELKKPEEKKTEKEIPKQKVIESKEPVKSVLPTGKSLNVGNNIYKYGDQFVVQVASFRAISISENEAGKYRNKGYTAFVETVEIPERGTWYRVKVGNFSTKDEALDFIKKNIR
jgi:cell division septation protein DedD/nucleoid DNA-binding protein